MPPSSPLLTAPSPDRRALLGHSARLVVLLAGSGLLPAAAQGSYNAAAFEAHNLAEVLKALGGRAPAESKEVSLTAPDIAENGAAVQIGLATTLPGARRLLLLVDKNPSALSAVFDLGEAIEASFTLRVKMAQSSNVYAVALMADGRALYAMKEVKVTLGGCG